MTIFLVSYTTGLNLTISNGTDFGWTTSASSDQWQWGCGNSTSFGRDNAGCDPIMLQEGGSTVKHVNWAWPDCLVGNGGSENGQCRNGNLNECLTGTARGAYNVCLGLYNPLSPCAVYTNSNADIYTPDVQAQ